MKTNYLAILAVLSTLSTYSFAASDHDHQGGGEGPKEPRHWQTQKKMKDAEEQKSTQNTLVPSQEEDSQNKKETREIGSLPNSSDESPSKTDDAPTVKRNFHHDGMLMNK